MTNATTVPGGLAAREPATPPARTPAEIEADIERTRARLADTVDAIAERVKPANVARRTFVDARREPAGQARRRAGGRGGRGRRPGPLAPVPLAPSPYAG